MVCSVGYHCQSVCQMSGRHCQYWQFVAIFDTRAFKPGTQAIEFKQLFLLPGMARFLFIKCHDAVKPAQQGRQGPHRRTRPYAPLRP